MKTGAKAELDGTHLTDIGYDAEGRLLVTGSSPGNDTQKDELLELVKDTTPEIVLQPAKTSRSPEVKRAPMVWKTSLKTWPATLSAIQVRLASDSEKSDPSLSQSWNDRAYIVHDGNPADAKLLFAGLSLYDLLRDKDAKRQDQLRKALPEGTSPDKTGELFAEEKFHDGYLAPSPEPSRRKSPDWCPPRPSRCRCRT